MIDWTKPVCTKHETPLIGDVIGDCRFHGVKRVLLASLSLETEPPTTYRYDQDGNARQGAGPSDYDLVNYTPGAGVVRMATDHRKVVEQ